MHCVFPPLLGRIAVLRTGAKMWPIVTDQVAWSVCHSSKPYKNG